MIVPHGMSQRRRWSEEDAEESPGCDSPLVRAREDKEQLRWSLQMSIWTPHTAVYTPCPQQIPKFSIDLFLKNYFDKDGTAN